MYDILYRHNSIEIIEHNQLYILHINQQMPEFNIIDDNDMQDRLDLFGNFDIGNPVGYNLQPVPVAPDLNIYKAKTISDYVLKNLKIEITKIKPTTTKGVLNLRSKISNLKKKKEAKSFKKELEKIDTAMELKQLLEDSEEAKRDSYKSM